MSRRMARRPSRFARWVRRNARGFGRAVVRRWKVAVVGASVSAALVGLVLSLPLMRSALAEAQWLQVRKVTTEGNWYLTRDEVLARVPDLLGTNPLALPVDSLQAFVADEPRIRAAEIKWNVFGTLTVRIDERRAVALVLRDGTPVEIDADGTTLPPVPGRVTRDLVFLSGDPDDGLKAGLELLAALRERSPALEHGLSEIDASEPSALLAYTLEGGTLIQFGSQDLTGQADRLALVMERAAHDPVAPRRIDLRFGERVFVEPGGVSRGAVRRTGDSGRNRREKG